MSSLFRTQALSAIPCCEHALFTCNIPGSANLYISKKRPYSEIKEQVEVSRTAAMQVLGYKNESLAILKQVHGTDVITVKELWDVAESPEADAMVTDKPGIMLGILTADCVPVLLADKTTPVVGIAHAGWKGALAGVLDNVVVAMEMLGSKREDIIAVIGACIHQKSYEVGEEFYETYLEKTVENKQFFIPSIRTGHYMFDLPGYSVMRLKGVGIGTIENIGMDTCADEANFFSYRRATLRGEPYERNNLSVIGMRG